MTRAEKRKIKPHFTGKLRVSLQKTSVDGGSGSWKVLTNLRFVSRVAEKEFIVPRGFVTDFGSVPRALPLAYALFGNIAQEAATLHDHLYTTHETTRCMADAVLREAMIATDSPKYKAYAWWIGVRLFGWTKSHWG